jgi:negative regulator of flagellin synthesis FlgM
MKIENILRPVGPSAVGSDSQGKPGKAGASAGAAIESGSEKVKLSPLSTQLKAVEAGLKDVPVVDKARVEEIKQAIAEGKFKVNADVVADKVIEAAKEVLSARTA